MATRKTKLKAVDNVHAMTTFHWTPEKSEAAMLLAEGYSYQQVANQIGKAKGTIYRWTVDVQFSAEVDRLSLMVGIASKAERLRLAKRIVRAKCTSDIMASDKDVLDWLKFAQSETDGANLNLTGLLASFTENAASVAEGGSGSARKASK